MTAIRALFITLVTLCPLIRSQEFGEGCYGNVSYCVGGNAGSQFILHCGGTTLYAGNCDDNLDEPPSGALCIESSPQAGDAVCSAVGGPPVSFPIVSGGLITTTTTSVSTSTSKPSSVVTSSVTTMSPSSSMTCSTRATTTVTPSVLPTFVSGATSLLARNSFVLTHCVLFGMIWAVMAHLLG